MRTVSHPESDAILGAMRQVALAGGHAISHADTESILGAAPLLSGNFAEGVGYRTDKEGENGF